MPETVADAGQTDNVGDDTRTDAQTSETVTPDGGDASVKLIAGKFKTVEETEKAYKEAERAITEKGNALAALQRQVEDLSQKAQLNEVLNRLAENAKPKEEPPKPRDLDSFAEEVGNDFATDAKTATRKMLNVMGSWSSQDRTTLERKLDALSTQLQSVLGKVAETEEKADPVYQKFKPLIDEMVQGGMNIKAAKLFVSKFNKDDESQTQSPPNHVSTGRVTPQGNVESYLTANEKAEMKREGYTDDDISAMEATHRRNLEQARKTKE